MNYYIDSKNIESICVKFKTSITEYWKLNHKDSLYVFNLPDENWFTNNDLDILHEFESRTNEFDNMFIIRHKDIKKAGFFQIRIMVHTLIKRLINEGFINVRYPNNILQDDLDRCMTTMEKDFWIGTNRLKSSRERSGLRLIEHFFDIREFKKSPSIKTMSECWTEHSLWFKINRIIKRNRDITRTNIFKECYRLGSGISPLTPGLWYNMIHRFVPESKTVFDLFPGTGSKGIACGKLGIEYHWNNTYVHSNAIKNLCAFVGFKYNNDPRDYYDLIILSDLKPISYIDAIDRLEKYKKVAKQRIIVVDRPTMEMLKLRDDKWQNTVMIGSLIADKFVLIY